jgi:hypothetical protein
MIQQLKYLQETTVWSTPIPNHTYIFHGSSCIGYIKSGSDEKIIFSKASKQFSKTRRQFKDVTKKYK